MDKFFNRVSIYEPTCAEAIFWFTYDNYASYMNFCEDICLDEAMCCPLGYALANFDDFKKYAAVKYGFTVIRPCIYDDDKTLISDYLYGGNVQP